MVSAAGGAPAGDIGGMRTLLNLAGLGYIAGGLPSGIALFRARVVPVGLGASLWRSHRATPVTETVTVIPAREHAVR